MSITFVPRRPYLVFIRAGTHSLHPKLLTEDFNRNWDCVVNWYAPPSPPQANEGRADYYFGGEGEFMNKLEGFLLLWKALTRDGVPWPYRYALILDDDIDFEPHDISYFFMLCDMHDTYLSQPGLRWFTHTTLNSLVRNPACMMHRVSFVECMAPCFSRKALEDLVATFTWTRSLWGVDWAWACLSEDHALHVIDFTPIRHTRTGDGRPTAFYRRLQSLGVDPGKDLISVRAQFPLFKGPRTLPDGHIYHPDIPRWLAPAAMYLFERFKFIVRLRKKFLRRYRTSRARVQDFIRDA